MKAKITIDLLAICFAQMSLYGAGNAGTAPVPLLGKAIFAAGASGVWNSRATSWTVSSRSLRNMRGC